MTRSPRCYVASPLGFTEAGRFYYEEQYLPALAAVVEPVNPWGRVDANEVAAATASGSLRELWLGVGRANVALIRDCQLLVAWLDGQEVDAGTATELGYAAALGLPCFGLRSDLREAGETGMAVNLQVEATIVASGGVIAHSLHDLVSVLRVALTEALTNQA